MRYLVVILLILLSQLLYLGVPQDAVTAYRRTSCGDRVRYFHYLQTYRHEGIWAALEKYGVEPKR